MFADFVNNFGTHYLSQAVLGGRVKQMTSAKANSESSLTNEELEQSSQSSFSNGFNVDLALKGGGGGGGDDDDGGSDDDDGAGDGGGEGYGEEAGDGEGESAGEGGEQLLQLRDRLTVRQGKGKGARLNVNAKWKNSKGSSGGSSSSEQALTHSKCEPPLAWLCVHTSLWTDGPLCSCVNEALAAICTNVCVRAVRLGIGISDTLDALRGRSP